MKKESFEIFTMSIIKIQIWVNQGMFLNKTVIVVGGGHAGIEAACASARIGCKTILVTHKIDTIGVNSCNPSWGGLGKGILVREIDALDGVCADLADRSGIRFTVLNRSKGNAVHGPRVSVDRQLYQKFALAKIKNYPNLELLEGSVDDLICTKLDDKVLGIKLSSGQEIRSDSIVIATGTFLQGRIQIGLKSFAAGRMGDAPSLKLSGTFQRMQLKLSRLRTGTPPRLSKKSINFKVLQNNYGEIPPEPLSFLTAYITQKQVQSYLTCTNQKTHEIILNNMHENTHVTQEVKGPRYCPSLESKVLKFPHKSNHHIWLEPEGMSSDIIYPNGMSMTFSEDIQQKIVQSVKGLGKAEILRPGYGVTYDFVDPRQLKHSLQVKKVEGLYLAGQINGTTGYEEAACQGIIAGANAALSASRRPEFIIDRYEGLTGVLIDDLVTKGADEPYRMFSCRSENRLFLRADNADARLSKKGFEIGLVGNSRFELTETKLQRIERIIRVMTSIVKTPHQWHDLGLNIVSLDGKSRSLYEIYGPYQVSNFLLFKAFPEFATSNLKDLNQIRISSKYHSYITKLEKEYVYVRKEKNFVLPDIDYSKLNSLSNEEKEKLSAVKPKRLRQISEISGLSERSAAIVYKYVKQNHNRLNL
eukprot:NODE_57_length_28844_cov_0.352687.p4 type:complete len:645 gc:universal NODE_57_length_28844_cov_0.352687:955-2889(+)